MLSYTSGFILNWVFMYIYTLGMRAVKSLASLRISASLVDDAL